MFRVTREFEFCFGHRLLNYQGKCQNIHGHNGKAVITLGSKELDSLGMVIDFVQIKRVMKTWIDDTLDHKLLLQKDDPIIPYLQQHGLPVFPMDENPTTENIAKLIYEVAKSKGLPILEVTMWETEYSYATYTE
ncbi:6-pyruvoyl trahydropterin synthase family protein [Tuwongella immobilis]|uniref:6-carboxy-5,6,7,8-tetrahydropterin synthase n=1 Tax=Tuwongella immobilis TaxID=692036 RepID=A0A6C2YNJ9_9BACT|nr:6-carboxytetrahydropterin synthase [Tuwongella immobilis]VIP03200.1 6-pyruvoyl-tetrahydropterin synthase OS=Singulisphaera acidiphila (strain ATCC BAA-1392 / DSM 18658 / VKM B-2454 / MOB10) GN=Sinac_5864 PE=4 SV=1: PTPS [Tuwongella immobilis]VTS03687.1 6-pyruvoyl-tetrahydropterin synthase OS=Singulisphaera acidiphila (strain ATCC BAA-1392 / DSM 18658 / VKM B-2454 / MOB10) GN=Sinac_5864 PE=4 SV=1: PTPS [Tuwongella immobilis]